jgi:hypothetical protein
MQSYRSGYDVRAWFQRARRRSLEADHNDDSSDVSAFGWASLLSPDADNHSDRSAFRPIVPIEKRQLAGKVEAAGIEPASAAAPAERLQA